MSDAAIAALVRAGRLDEAEALLGAGTPAPAISITGWEHVQHLVFRPLPGSKRLCAGVALVAATEEAAPGDPGPAGTHGAPSLEIEFHTGAAFPFAGVTPEAVAEEDAQPSPRWGEGVERLPGARLAVDGLTEVAPDDRVGQWLRTIAFHRAVQRVLQEEGLARRLPVLVQVRRYAQGRGEWRRRPGDAEGAFLTALRIPARSREPAEDAIARMIAVRDEELRELRRRHREELREAADSMRELRSALRETRLFPSSKARTLRGAYEAKERVVFEAQRAATPAKPSWTIVDDGEFERFLQRHYVDAFLH